MNTQTEQVSIQNIHRKPGLMKRLVGQEKKHLLVTSHGLEFAAIIPIADYNEFKKHMTQVGDKEA